MRGAPTWICSNCLRAYSPPTLKSQKSIVQRAISIYSSLLAGQSTVPKNEDEAVTRDVQQERGAMSRRLFEMAEATMDTGSKSDRKMVKDAGFSKELKRKLEERMTQTAFQAQNQQAFSEANMPVGFVQ